MAGTTSATTRQSHALTAIRSAGLKRVRSTMLFLGKDDFARGTCIASAALLSACGILAPHINSGLLGPLLCLSGAALALLAANRSFDATRLGEPASLGAVRTPRTCTRSSAMPATLAELTHATARPARNDPEAVRWSRLTHRMSHELRTPLNAVIGFSELMNAEVFGPLAPQYQDYARSIHTSGRILLKNAEDALAITNLLTLDTPACDPLACLRTALDEALAFHRPELAARGLMPQVEICGKDEVLGEPQTVRQILVNVLAVSLKEAEPGAALMLQVRELPDEIVVELAADTTRPTGDEDCFALLLARTLAQLSQARLVRSSGAQAGRISVYFPRARQRDFFTA